MMVPNVHVVFEGQKKLELLQPILVSIEQRINTVSTALLTLSSQGNSLLLSQINEEIKLCKPGGVVSISISGAELKKEETIFSGVVVSQELEFEKQSALLTLKLKHKLCCLESGCHSQVFENKSASEIISNFLQSQSIQFQDLAQMNTKIEQLIQFRCSDWSYMRKLLDDNGAWLLPNPGNVKIVKPELEAATVRTIKQNELIIVATGEDKARLLEAKWIFNDQYQPKKLQLTAWDISQQKNISANAIAETLGNGAINPAGLKPLNDAPWVIGSSTSVTQDELNNRANSILQHLQESGVQGNFKIFGAVGFELGKTLALKGFGDYFDGSGIITGIVHSINKEEWTTNIQLGVSGGSALVMKSNTLTELQVGVISKFKADPNQLERVRVTLPSLGESNNELWARLTMPYATKEKGFAFYPEQDDEVAVGFFDNSPDYPVILGSMYNPKNKAPIPLSEKNNIKGIYFGDLLFQFDAKDEIVVMKSDANSVELGKLVKIEGKSGEETVQINGGKKAEIKATNINLVK